MKLYIEILLLVMVSLNINAQSMINEIYESQDSSVTMHKRLIKKNHYDNKGNLVIEEFFNFKAFGDKLERNGKIEYEYRNNKLKKIFYSNPLNGDTVRTIIKYRFNSTITKTKELITESRIKKGLIYGDGTPNGCIVPEEALEYYKIWEYRLHKKSIMKQNRKKKEYIYFDYGTNSHNYEYQYDSMGRLVEEKKIIRRVNNLAWKKTFEYQKDRLIILREFFITYWDKIPPIERETQFFDENNKITKIERSNMKDIENGTILKKYDEKGDSVIEEYYDVFGKFVRKHIIIFQ